MFVNEYFLDLHIHLGSTASGKPVKITASKSLTLENIIVEARDNKGLDMIGIIDCHVPEVMMQLEQWKNEGNLVEENGGGVSFKGLTLLLGSEIEIYDENCKGPIHVLCFLPTIDKMRLFSEWFAKRVTNITLSSQRIYESGRVLQEKVHELDGLFIPAHIFTPFKSLYGKGVVKSITEVFDAYLVDGVELGLSSNTLMASSVAELAPYPFLTNSDAHSLNKIAREYQLVTMKEPTFAEFRKVLKGEDGRRVMKNFGLNPYLGKYYNTACEKCFTLRVNEERYCTNCGHSKFTKGVSERIKELGHVTIDTAFRPPYIHQIPLEFIPGVGPKTLYKLRAAFQTEMNILHNVTEKELVEIVGEKIGTLIMKARSGELSFKAGGAGKFGSVTPE
ncbi:hypothetical protein BC6307_14055 [Sutcliffiella cohnii]|uniref:TIGR00375 family protein n=1 Tax=Sutcliffiella cohnii TaxID=33932 RepID=A0A223KS59_9BACI|nr:hypothetical protein BC6307_14055 [Sutcliffiella cohnii]